MITSVRRNTSGSGPEVVSDYFELGLICGTDYVKFKKYALTKWEPVALQYRFGKEPIFDSELALAVKCIYDYIQCEINKKECKDWKDQAKENKDLFKKKTLLITKESICHTDSCIATINNMFPCKVEIVDNIASHISKNPDEQESYAFLATAAERLGWLGNVFYIVDLKTFQILVRDFPNARDFTESIISESRLRKIAELYKK
jgi:hypothetical protein